MTSAEGNKVVFKKRVIKPMLWSSENPTLYTLLIKCDCEGTVTYKSIRFGFKQVEIGNGSEVEIQAETDSSSVIFKCKLGFK